VSPAGAGAVRCPLGERNGAAMVPKSPASASIIAFGRKSPAGKVAPAKSPARAPRAPPPPPPPPGGSIAAALKAVAPSASSVPAPPPPPPSAKPAVAADAAAVGLGPNLAEEIAAASSKLRKASATTAAAPTKPAAATGGMPALGADQLSNLRAGLRPVKPRSPAKAAASPAKLPKSPAKPPKSPAKAAALTPHTKAARDLVCSAVQSLVTAEANVIAEAKTAEVDQAPTAAAAVAATPKSPAKAPKSPAKSPAKSSASGKMAGAAAPRFTDNSPPVDAVRQPLAVSVPVPVVETAEETAPPTSAQKSSPKAKRQKCTQKSPVKIRKAVGFTSPEPSPARAPASRTRRSAAAADSDSDFDAEEDADQVPSSVAPKSPGRPALKVK